MNGSTDCCPCLTEYTDKWRFRPAYNSCTGRFLSAIEYPIWSKSLGTLDFIIKVIKCLFIGLGVMLTSAVDFTLLLGMSILIFPWILFPKSHVTNLIISLANCIIGFMSAFGTEAHARRKFCGETIPKEEARFLYSSPEEERIKGLNALQEKIESQTAEENKAQSELLLRELGFHLYERYTVHRYSPRGFEVLNQLLTTMIERGVDINHSIRPHEQDDAKCYLIHYFAEMLYYLPSNQEENVWKLIELVLDHGADPHQPINIGRGVTSVPYNFNVFDVLIAQGYTKFIRIAFTKYYHQFSLDQPRITKTLGYHVDDYGTVQGDKMCNTISASPLLYLIFLEYSINNGDLQRKWLPTLATLLDLGVRFSPEQEEVYNQIKKDSEKALSSVQLIEAMQLEATASLKFWAMNYLLNKKMPRLFRIVLTPLASPLQNEMHIQALNTLFTDAIKVYERDYIEIMLELLPLAFTSEKVSKTIEWLEQDVAQTASLMKAKVTAVFDEMVQENRRKIIGILDLLQNHKSKISSKLEHSGCLQGEGSNAITPIPTAVINIMADYCCPGLGLKMESADQNIREIGKNIVDVPTETDDTHYS